MDFIFSKCKKFFSRFRRQTASTSKESSLRGKYVISSSDPDAGSQEHLRSFNQRQENEEAFESIERGTSMVPLAKITGSVGRYHDFDNQFKEGACKRDERLEMIVQAMRAGKRIEPIALYQIKNDYYILDGHHRFLAAQKLGYTEIRARIVELLPSRDTLENRIYLEKMSFRDRAGLTHDIELTELGQYRYLEKQIADHQQFLSQEKNQAISYEQAAKDWYETIYKPLAAIIESKGVVHAFKGRTNDDLYLYISRHQWELGKKRRYGIGVDLLIPKDMEKFRSDMMREKQQHYPEMRRQMTVFILLNVDGRYEQKIFDKLLVLKEVREVHSVHGSIDIIVKVVLERDLLSSDAEILSDFILNTIRKWTGVISTQTLIPGASKIKDDKGCVGEGNGTLATTY